MAGAAIINQDSTHQLRRNPEELVSVLPLSFTLIDQTEVSFVHEGGRLQSMVDTFLFEVVRGQAPQFGVEQRNQGGHCLLLAPA